MLVLVVENQNSLINNIKVKGLAFASPFLFKQFLKLCFFGGTRASADFSIVALSVAKFCYGIFVCFISVIFFESIDILVNNLMRRRFFNWVVHTFLMIEKVCVIGQVF